MRRLTPGLLGLALALTLPHSASGQELAIGARGALTVTNADFQGSFIESTSAKNGWSAGLILQAKVSRVVELQTGVWFTKKGFKGSGGTGGNSEVKQSFFEIPMLLGIRFPIGTLSPHILTGPVLSIETSCKASADGASPPFTNAECDDLNLGPNTKGADFGYLIGAGLEYELATRVNLIFDVMYNIGLTNLAEFNPGVDSIKNRALYFSFGVLFPIGGSRIEDTVPELQN